MTFSPPRRRRSDGGSVVGGVNGDGGNGGKQLDAAAAVATPDEPGDLVAGDGAVSAGNADTARAQGAVADSGRGGGEEGEEGGRAGGGERVSEGVGTPDPLTQETRWVTEQGEATAVEFSPVTPPARDARAAAGGENDEMQQPDAARAGAHASPSPSLTGLLQTPGGGDVIASSADSPGSMCICVYLCVYCLRSLSACPCPGLHLWDLCLGFDRDEVILLRLDVRFTPAQLCARHLQRERGGCRQCS